MERRLEETVRYILHRTKQVLDDRDLEANFSSVLKIKLGHLSIHGGTQLQGIRKSHMRRRTETYVTESSQLFFCSMMVTMLSNIF